MRTQIYRHTVKDFAVGYTLWLSADETYRWARRTGQSWPCSQLAGKRLRVDVDNSGLCDLAVNGRTCDVSADELSAIVADHLLDAARGLWPTWEN
ncbi:MAG: hypothetical protein ACYTEQ_29200 [Planctomycetota bacterium]|jgi:hypothetical protein